MFQNAHELSPHPTIVPVPRELCQLAVDWDGKLPIGGAMVEEKINGWRGLWLNGELVTREGAPFYSVEHIVEACRAIEARASEPLFLDGEFQAGGSFDGTIAHQAQRGRPDDAGTLHLFDCMTMAEWRSGGTDKPLWARKAGLAALVAPIAEPSPVQMVPDQWAFDEADVQSMASEVYARGGEGVMVKDVDGRYLRGRTTSWRKEKLRA